MKKILIWIASLLSIIAACRQVFYLGGSNPLYTKAYNDFSKKVIDSACVCLLIKYPEHKAHFKGNHTDTTEYFDNIKVYNATNIYYPYAPGYMGRFYLNQCLDSSLYYIYTITEREAYRELMLKYILKEGSKYPIYGDQLSRREKKIIVKRFEEEIITKIDYLVKEMSNLTTQ